jgi:hypothetical protein
MRRTLIRLLAIGAIATLILAARAAVVAQTGYELNWWTVDGGGGASTGEAYALGSTAGQPDTGTATGGDYALSGGFWAGTGPDLSHQSFLPAAARNAGQAAP